MDVYPLICCFFFAFLTYINAVDIPSSRSNDGSHSRRVVSSFVAAVLAFVSLVAFLNKAYPVKSNKNNVETVIKEK